MEDLATGGSTAVKNLVTIDLLKEPSANNILNGWILDLFNGSPVVAKAFATFSSTVSLYGAFCLIWAILLGIVSSAYSGKVLGERYHQIWAPLRVVLGFGLIIPIAGGFSSVHYALRDVARPISVNLADAPARVVAEMVFGEGEAIAPYRTGGMQLVYDLMEHELCAAMINHAAKNSRINPSPVPAAGGQTEGWGIFSDKSQVWDWGPRCGKMSFSLPTDKEEFTKARVKVVADTITAIREVVVEYAEFFNKHGTDFNKEAIEQIGVGAITLFGKLTTLAADADKRIVESAKKEISPLFPESRKALVETIKEEGFMALGGAALTLSQNSALTTSLTNEQAENTSPDYEASNAITKDAMKVIRQQLGLGAQYMKADANDLAAASDSTSGVVTRMLAPIFRSIFEFVGKGERVDNAFSHISGTGQNLKAAAGGIIVGGGIVKAASGNIAGKWVGAEAVIDWLLQWVSWGVMVLFVLGWMRADLFPMIPYIMMIVMAVTVLLGYVKAMSGGVMWGLSFVRMDGSDFMEQRQAAGWNKIIELVLRPVFYVLGFIASFVIFDQVYSYINMSLATYYFGSLGGVLPDPVNLITFYVFDTILAWVLIFNLFGHIGNLVEDALDWFGVNVRSSGHGQEVTAAAVGVGAAVQKMPTGQGNAIGAVAKTVQSIKKNPTPAAGISKAD